MFLRMPRLRKMTKPKPRKPVHFLPSNSDADYGGAVTACGKLARLVTAWTVEHVNVTCMGCLRSQEWYRARVNAALSKPAME